MTKNLEPNSGRIFINGRNLKNITLKEFASKVAIVQQYNETYARLSRMSSSKRSVSCPLTGCAAGARRSRSPKFVREE